jgi:hypothetical protein
MLPEYALSTQKFENVRFHTMKFIVMAQKYSDVSIWYEG